MFTRCLVLGDALLAQRRARREEPMSSKAEVARVARGRHWREADAQIMVEAWHSSGETLSEFADRQGVDSKRVARWASRLGRAKPEAMHFHPVRLAGEEPQSVSGSTIEIQLVG